MTALRLLLALALTCAPVLARADEAPDPRPTKFGAEPAAPAPRIVAPDDYKGLLENCDLVVKDTTRKLAACKQDETGIGFLGAAYLALWVILMGFFIHTRMRQKKLTEEMRTLRERLARLSDDA
jgi:hypothetical protein